MTVLRVAHLTVTYPNGHRGLDDLSFSVEAGERRAVVGRSGSGKSTLVLAILGLLPPGTRVTGSILVDGHELVGADEATLRRLRGPVIGYVPQDPFAATDPLRTVGHHVGEAWRAHRRRPPAGAVAEGLAAVEIDDAARRAGHRPHQWSGGMLQRATLVAATAHAPRLTLADEPTSALDAELADDMLHALRRRGGALLLISHDLALVARHTEHVLVLAGGRAVEQGPAARLLAAPAAPETAELVAAAAPPPARTRTSRREGPVVAEVREVSRRYGTVTAVDGVSLTVSAGEVVGIVGRSGSGKSTLARIVAGLEAPDTGASSLREAAARRPGHVMPIFQDPVASLDRRWPLWRTLAEPRRARGERLDRTRARTLAVEALDGVGLTGIDVARRPGSLSVGQAQRVAIARALLARPALLIADEPTASLDVAAAAAITALLRGLADAGTAVLVVSHDRPRLAGYADRVLVMSGGRLDG
ncbi:ABC transporter ATP-binding protein [Pseudonocardia ailaonensis]|uniref:ABC transporter ATP-binding protein n=1 Tax=Pseudonocardia ailaonensis TaxID=367279 RepID=A0ABN2N404_9PSEU